MRGLKADLALRLGDLDLELDLTIGPAEIVVLIGPNGAGKSTTLRALAGLQPCDRARIDLDDRCLDDTSAGIGVISPDRGVGMVFQDYLLFPHLSARDNVAFGLRSAGEGRRTARHTAGEWLGRVGLSAVADARPGQLSGGQAQRVALARALAPGPRMLLLDEPLSALDAQTRMRVRTDLQRHLTEYGGVTVVVTHDPLDALVLATRIIVLEAGRVVQDGAPADVARHPGTDYVAGLMGLNLLRGNASLGEVHLPDGTTLRVVDDPPDGEVMVTCSPSSVAVHRMRSDGSRPDGSPRNCLALTVAQLEPRGDVVRLALTGQVELMADVTATAVAELDLQPGRPVWAVIKATELHSYPR